MKTAIAQLPSINLQVLQLAATSVSTWCEQNSLVRVWAFGVAVRLSDQNRPLALKLLVELANLVHLLLGTVQRSRGEAKTFVLKRVGAPGAQRRPGRGNQRVPAVAAEDRYALSRPEARPARQSGSQRGAVRPVRSTQACTVRRQRAMSASIIPCRAGFRPSWDGVRRP